jgi:twitching motility protein PilT
VASEPPPLHGTIGSGEKRELRLSQYFRAMVKQEASDLHFKAGAPPHIRLGSLITPVKGPALAPAEIESLAMEILNEKEKVYFATHGSIDVAEELEGSDRFRINIYRQRGMVSIAVRRVSRAIPTFEELHLPTGLEKIADHGLGLILVAGMSGSGKSTTIAAMLEYINQHRQCHIVTIEDPIEYLYTDNKALINQREVGIDVPDFPTALRVLFREDPDVVLIGEMRDRETFQAALQAAETGHLVFGTVHSSSAASTVGRILDLFEKESRDLARQALAFNLRAIVCQRLLPCLLDGVDRVPAVEILLNNPSARQMIEEERDPELMDVIRSSLHEGMQDFNNSLLKLIEKDYVDPKVAYEAANNPEELKMMLKGISASRSGLLGH